MDIYALTYCEMTKTQKSITENEYPFKETKRNWFGTKINLEYD